ncbi:hypothetical protein PU560_17690 [Georgenia sp. 10Sc9-8]|uniref:Uncharacterized protein n=1 Tax=Georgenia halotolerans TaxID=3028317 RepID=A0ABT5U1T8_9MICO|nr:hypothetical protein [Georgenia halotolerans]
MPDENTAPELTVGVVHAPGVADHLRESLTTGLPALLSERFPGVRWRLEPVTDALVVPPAGALDLLEAARDRMLEDDWDLTVVLTDLPVRDARRTVLTQASPVHGVGLVSVPALGAVNVRQKARAAVLRTVSTLLGESGDRPAGDALTARLSQLSTDTPLHARDSTVRFVARVLGGNARLLAGMVRANRPWRLAMSLSRALTAAFATGVLVLVTADIWLLAGAYGPLRLAALGLIAVGAVTTTLIVGAELWERPRAPREREQVAMFNTATAATVVIGVLVFYTALYVLSQLGALLLVDAGVFGDALGRPVGGADYAKLAWLTATLATVGGALGAGLESDDAVRQAAYTRRSELTEEDSLAQS